MFEVADKLLLIGFHLVKNLCVRFCDGVRGRLLLMRVFRSRRRHGPPREHFRKLGSVISPRGKNLRALVQIVRPYFVESIGLAVMRFRVLGEVLDAEESGDRKSTRLNSSHE